MKFIAHRGNVYGKDEKWENTSKYIMEAIDAGFDVELDVWFVDGQFYLGHDEPGEKLPIVALLTTKKWKNLWFHCKNLEAIFEFSNETLDFDFFNAEWDSFTHYFWHDNDAVTLTSLGYLWTYPGEKLSSNSICVGPDWDDVNYTDEELKGCAGICSDFIAEHRERLQIS